MRSKLRSMMPWFTLDMLLFVILNIIFLNKASGSLDVLSNISFLKLLILGLAAYRAANILSNEVVTKPLRAPFMVEKETENKIIESPKPKGFLGATGTLLYCPSCTGVWLSAALVYAYAFWPAQTFLVALFLALSGFERIIANFIGFLKTR